MRILIGYDGSECAGVAVDDLARAGLGDDVEARVMSVADVWPHLPESCYDEPARQPLHEMTPIVRRAHELAAAEMADARQTAGDGARRVARRYASWKVEPFACAGAPAASLVRAAGEWEADLVVVGSQGRGAIGRALLGSVSQAVVMQAPCSVRVARSRRSQADVPPRIVLGLDGSPGAAAALSAVSMRNWPSGTEVRAVVAVDVRLATVLPTMTPDIVLPPALDPGSQDWPKHAAEGAAHELRRAGLSAAPVVRDGDPKRVLVEEAEQWQADCVFVGARGLGRLEGMLLGSVSTAVAARASCSVEVVRFE